MTTAMTPPKQRRKVLGGAARYVRGVRTQAEIAQGINKLRLQRVAEAEANGQPVTQEDRKPVSHTTVSHIESGRDRYVSLQLMVDLAEVLGCDLNTITYLANVYEVRADEAAA